MYFTSFTNYSRKGTKNTVTHIQCANTIKRSSLFMYTHTYTMTRSLYSCIYTHIQSLRVINAPV